MKHLLDKGGAFGAFIAAVAAPCCFPLLAPLGFALGFGALLPWAEYALYGVAVCTVLAMVGSVVAFRSHRHLGWLLLGIGSGLLVLPALAFPWPPSLAYAGLLGLAVAAGRQSCARPSHGVHHAAEQPSPSSPGAPLAKGEMASRG